MNASPPNPQLVEALKDAPSIIDYQKHLDQRMKTLAAEVLKDSFAMRPNAYSRQTYTVAVLIAGDVTIQQLAADNGINLRPFHDLVGQMQQLILVNTNKPAPAAKVAKVLRNLCGI